MNKRIAKKIVSGCGIDPGESRAAKWGINQYDRAHRIFARKRLRVEGLRMTQPRSRSALAVLGGSYFTIGTNFVYLVDAKTGRRLLPVFKTKTQRREVLAEIIRLGGSVDGEKIIVDGGALVDTMPRENDGRPVAIVVDFAMRGDSISHTIITLGPPPAFGAGAEIAK